MRENDGCGVDGQCLLDHLARVDAGTINRAAEQFLEVQHAMPVIEIQAAKYLVRPRRC